MSEQMVISDRIAAQPTTDDEILLAEHLDVFARALESGDSDAAERVLFEHPELVRQAGGHIESLRLLCQPILNRGDDKTPSATHRPVLDVSLSTLGDYQIHREIGRGGMGIVYEATQLSLNRTVAVKVLPFAAVLDQQQIRRFRNEAHAAASLHHSHIVPVYGVGCERGVHYYSMQLINGQSLEQAYGFNGALGKTSTHDATPDSDPSSAVKKDAVNFDLYDVSTKVTRRHNCSTLNSVPDRGFIRDKVQLVIRVADALHYAHGEGVIHRDIKPSNLLIDESGKVWIADFGLARVRGVGNITADGSLMGTIRYMSPEQIAGRPEAVDHRTDIYSLGVTLYEILTRQPAFDGSHREQLMRAVETQDPISPRRINPAIAVDLETIVFKAIAKDKDDRYTTAGEMADDLRRFLEGRSTLARRPTAVDLAFKWAIRRRSVVLASLLVLVSVVIGLTGSMMIISRHSGEKDLALVRAEHHLQQAHSAVDRFGRLYADKLTGLPATETLRRDVLREAERYYVDFIGYAESDPLLRQEMATVRFRLGGVLADLGDPNGAIESYENAIADLQKLRLQLPRDSKLISDLAACLHNLAKRFKDLGDFENAVQAYRQAAAYQQTAMRENLADSAITQWSATQTNLALLLIESGDSADAMKLLEETLAELEIEAKRDSANAMVVLQRSETRNALVAILLKNDPLRAEDLLSQSITELEKLSAESIQRGETREDLAFRTVCQLSTARNNLATLLGRRNKTSEAIQLTAEAIAELEAATKAFPSDQTIGQQMAIALNNHGQLLFDSGQVREADVSFANAEKMFRQVVSARPELPQPKSRLAGVLHNRGVVRAANGDFAQAAELLQDAISFQLAAIEESSFSLQYHQYLAAHRELLADVLHQENPSAQSAELGSAAGKLQTELLDESE